MKRVILIVILIFAMVIPVSAMEFTAPQAPGKAEEYLPESAGSFGEDLWYIIKTAATDVLPSISEAASVCFCVIAAVLLIAVIQSLTDNVKRTAEFVGAIAVGLLLMQPANVMIKLGTETIIELSEYGKLLLPVISAALAAQGGTTTSASLYAGTAVFSSALSILISKLLVPMLYIFLFLSIACCAIREEVLQNIRNLIKWAISWCLKIILYVFTGYMSITGVVSGSVDASAIKAAKLAISGMVPVVGGIISDASESIIISASVMKNAVGVYGLLVLIALIVGPFIKIGAQYLLLKATAAICGSFGTKNTGELIHDFSVAMGLILAITGTVCLLLLISTVCFMKGVS